jgi:hypothetical protein
LISSRIVHPHTPLQFAPGILHSPNSSVMSASDEQLEIAISYAHRDQALKDELILHLSPLRRQGIIAHWHDRNIDAGDDWKQEIDTHFNTAGMILLLVSPDFIASDYCYDIEMKRALERHDAGECRVIPVFLRACHWKGAPFGRSSMVMS